MVESTGGSSPARDTGAFRSPAQQSGPERVPPAAPAQKEGGILNQAKQKAGEWSDAVVEKTKDLVEDGKSFAHQAKESARDWAHTAGETVDEARSAVGQGIERFGGGVREKGSSASAIVGGRLEAAGAYLREHDFAGMNESMKDVVRRHPVQSVLVGIGLGFILARAMRRA